MADINKEIKKPTKKLLKPEKTRWRMHLHRLANFQRERGWTVVLNGKKDFCFLDRERISLRKGKRTYESMTYYLLFFLGFILMIKKYGRYADIAKKQNIVVDSLPWKMINLEERIDAWRCGLDIGESMNLPINHRNFETVKARYLEKFIVDYLISDRRLIKALRRAITKPKKSTKKPVDKKK